MAGVLSHVWACQLDPEGRGHFLDFWQEPRSPETPFTLFLLSRWEYIHIHFLHGDHRGLRIDKFTFGHHSPWFGESLSEFTVQQGH